MIRQVPFSVPNFRENDYEKVIESLNSGWLAHGPFSKTFENEFKWKDRKLRFTCERY